MPVRTMLRRSGGIRRGLDERVVLATAHGFESGVRDQTLHLRRCRPVSRVGGGDDILFDHQRSKIIAAKSQRNLSDLHSHGYPARLKIGNVVKDDARNRNGSQIFVRACLRHMRHRRCILGLKRPADERREPASARLHFANSLKMLHSLRECLADTIHHRHGGFHPFSVSELHYLEPAVGARFLASDEITNALNQNLTTTTGNRIESCRSQLSYHLDRFHAEKLCKEIDLARAESVDVNRMIAFDVTHQIQIPIEWYVRV